MQVNEKGQFIKEPLHERFWDKVNIPCKEICENGIRFHTQMLDECWEWRGNTNLLGYGILANTYGKSPAKLRAHRVSWQLNKGKIPRGLNVLHHCDNPRCVNPRHLHLGTHADNHRDRIAHGKRLTGENNGMAKLTAELVAEIRAAFVPRGKGWKRGKKKGDWTNEGSPKWLAEKYGISIAHVQRILVGDRWQ